MYRFKILDKITVNNYLQANDTIHLCCYDNTYYLLEHFNAVKEKLLPLDNGYYTVKEGIEVKVINAKNKEDLLSRYIDRFLVDSINPFKVLLLYKRYQCQLNVNPKLKEILERNKDIPEHILQEQSELLEYLEMKRPNARIVIDASILDAITEILRLLKEKEELLQKAEMHKDKLKVRLLSLKDLILESINVSQELVEYPPRSKLIAKVEAELFSLEHDIKKIEEKLLQQQKKEEEEEDIQIGTNGSSTITMNDRPNNPDPTVSFNNIDSSSNVDSSNNINSSGTSPTIIAYSFYMRLSRALSNDEQEYLKQGIIQMLERIGVKVKEYKVLRP